MNILQTIRDFLKFSAVNKFNPESTTGKVEDLRLLVLNNYNELVSILISDIPGGGGGSQDFQSVTDIGISTTNSFYKKVSDEDETIKSGVFEAEGAEEGIQFMGHRSILEGSMYVFGMALGETGSLVHSNTDPLTPYINSFQLPVKVNGTYTLATLEDIAELRNEQGQVKVNYTGLSTTGFTAEVIKTLDINAATPTLVSSPTTIFPYSTPNTYSGFFDTARGSSPTGRLIENPVDGQVHTWRFQIGYSAKGVSNNGSFDLILTNPVSGFQYVMPFTLPSGRTSGTLNNVAITIADGASIPAPNGYILQCRTSFTDANLAIDSISITRISQAVENI